MFFSFFSRFLIALYNTFRQGSSPPMSQTTVEESVVYRHMIENPFQQAVKEHEARENLKRRRLDMTSEYDPMRIQEHLDEIKQLKAEIDTLNGQQERARAFQTEFARRYRESVRNITGYDIKMRSEEFIEVNLLLFFDFCYNDFIFRLQIFMILLTTLNFIAMVKRLICSLLITPNYGHNFMKSICKNMIHSHVSCLL